MIKSVTYNPETKLTTVEKILLPEDEPCGEDTDFVFKNAISGVGDKCMAVTTGTMQADRITFNAK